MNLHNIPHSGFFPHIPRWTQKDYIENDILCGQLKCMERVNGKLLGLWQSDVSTLQYVIWVLEFEHEPEEYVTQISESLLKHSRSWMLVGGATVESMEKGESLF